MSLNTNTIVNKLLLSFSAGVIHKKGFVPEECLDVLDKIFSNQDDLLSQYQRLLNHMKRINLIQREKLSDGNTYIMLTAKGKKRLKSAELQEIAIPNQERWDKKWRVLSFDIPRELRSQRYEFLRELHRLGFEKLLQSMWVYPFPCEVQVNQIASLLGLKDSIVYLEANLDEENNKYLSKHFSHLLN